MAGLSIHHPWAFTFGILGNLISFMVYLAPLPTFYRVYRKKSTEGFQSVPYVVALFSATLWIFYALLKDDACLLITINSVGCVIETAYIVVFFIYAPKAAKIFTAKLVAGVNMGMFGVILLLTLLLSEGSKRVEVLGWICMIFSVCVFVAPLSVIRLVIRTKSVEYMPFWLSFFLTLTAIVWFAYGLLTKDVYVALPNVLGFGFGVLQMLLYIVYKESKKVVVVAVERKEVPERAAVPMAKLGMEKVVELYPDAEMSPSAEEGRQQEYTVLNMANINREVILVQKLDQLDEEDQSNEEEEEEEEEEEVNKNIRNLEV